jgi:hypothetical protein
MVTLGFAAGKRRSRLQVALFMRINTKKHNMNIPYMAMELLIGLQEVVQVQI